MSGERRTLRLHGQALLEALVARDEGLLATYVDLSDGAFVRLYDPAITGRANAAVHARLDAEPDRFAEIPRFTRSYRLMADFVDTVEDDDLARLLDTALSGREAFRRFDAVLAGWPVEQARWGEYRRDALTSWAAAWLRSLDIEPAWELTTPPEAPSAVPELLAVALSQGPAVHQAASAAEAGLLFRRMARQLCELRNEPFFGRRLRGRTKFQRGGVEIRLDGDRVILHLTE